LIVGKGDDRRFEKAMRLMTRVRTELVVGFKSSHDETKWDDWNLVSYVTKYKKGRRVNEWRGY
jgi:hypothetical protein